MGGTQVFFSSGIHKLSLGSILHFLSVTKLASAKNIFPLHNMQNYYLQEYKFKTSWLFLSTCSSVLKHSRFG